MMDIFNKVRRTCRSILLLGMLLVSTMSFAQTTRTAYCMCLGSVCLLWIDFLQQAVGVSPFIHEV